HLGQVGTKPDDGVHAAWIRGFRDIGGRRYGGAGRVRVIDAEYLEAARPPVTTGVDVILRVDDEPRHRRRSHVARAAHLDDRVVTTEEDAAALSRSVLARMRDQVLSNLTSRGHVTLGTWDLRLET